MSPSVIVWQASGSPALDVCVDLVPHGSRPDLVGRSHVCYVCGQFCARAQSTRRWMGGSFTSQTVVRAPWSEWICEPGLATNKPAEFIILRISQDTRALEAELAAAGA